MNRQYDLTPEFEQLFQQNTEYETGTPAAAAVAPNPRKAPSYIKWVQTCLNLLLNLQLTVDGISGTHTRSAIRSFQTQRSLGVDGIVGPITEQALMNAIAAGWQGFTDDQRALYIMERLVNQHSFPVNGAAGLVGNLKAESELRPNIIEGSNAATPMRGLDFNRVRRDFTTAEIRDRNVARKIGPLGPGIGLAQWTFHTRRRGLFQHQFQGRTPVPEILFNVDAQLDFLATELSTGSTAFRRVNNILRAPAVTLNDASDEVVFNFERPASVVGKSRTHAQVQAIFAGRRTRSRAALAAYRAVHP